MKNYHFPTVFPKVFQFSHAFSCGFPKKSRVDYHTLPIFFLENWGTGNVGPSLRFEPDQAAFGDQSVSRGPDTWCFSPGWLLTIGTYNTWLVVTGTWLLFSHILGMLSSQLTHIFQVGWNHQPDTYYLTFWRNIDHSGNLLHSYWK